MKASNRILMALKDGWTIGDIKIGRDKTQRNSMWVSRNGWQCHKATVTGDEEKDIHALLDEAGVPKYNS